MEVLFQLGIGLAMICAFVFVIGLILLLASNGKSKPALRMVLGSAIAIVVIFLIGLGTCIFSITR